MPVHQTGFTGEAVVPCSHCNVNDGGPEAGICHRGSLGSNSPQDGPCSLCLNTAYGDGGRVGILKALRLGVLGHGYRTPCSYCAAKGYVKL